MADLTLNFAVCDSTTADATPIGVSLTQDQESNDKFTILVHDNCQDSLICNGNNKADQRCCDSGASKMAVSLGELDMSNTAVQLIPGVVEDDKDDTSTDSEFSVNNEEDENIGNRKRENLVNDHDELAGEPNELTENAEFTPPDDETLAAICGQAEQLFSDEGLLKESYLQKHIRRNKLGFVSLKVFNSLRKMKRLTRDHRAIACAIQRFSTTLELNETATKLRRKEAPTLPVLQSALAVDECVVPEYRTVIVTNLPQDVRHTVESVAELFSKCGTVSQIRLLRSGSGGLEGLRSDLVRSVERQIGHDNGVAGSNGRQFAAIVEFENLSSAKRACKKMNNKTDWRHGMRVTLLAVQPLVKKDSRSNKDGSVERDDGGHDDQKSGDSSHYDDFKKQHKKKKRRSRVDELVHGESPYSSGGGGHSVHSSSGSETEGRGSGHKPGSSSRYSSSPAGGGSSDPISIIRRQSGGRNSPLMGSPAKNSPLTTATHGAGHRFPLAADIHDSDSEDWRARTSSFGSDLGTSPSRSQSPWAQRRMKAQQAAAGGSPGGDRSADSDKGGAFDRRSSGAGLLDAGNVIRQPKGPDGSSGFKSRNKVA